MATHGRRTGQAVPYDFRRPSKLSRDHVRLLEHAGDTFARQWATLLTSSLRVAVRLSCTGVEQHTYEEWVATLPEAAVLGVFRPEPLDGTAILQLAGASALAYVERSLGGGGERADDPSVTPLVVPERPLTAIELVVVETMLRRALAEMGYAFEQVAPMSPELVSLEQNAQFLQAAAATDVIVVLTFEVVMASSTAKASMMLPLSPLISRMDATSASTSRRDDHHRANALVREHLGQSLTFLGARLRGGSMHGQQVLDLAVGDVVRLEHRSDEPAELVTGDVVVGHAVPGSSGSRLACLVVPSPSATGRPSGTLAALHRPPATGSPVRPPSPASPIPAALGSAVAAATQDPSYQESR